MKNRREELQMKKIIFATGNQDKMGEIRSILSDWDMELQSMKEAGIELDIVEDGTSFEENAVLRPLQLQRRSRRKESSCLRMIPDWRLII